MANSQYAEYMYLIPTLQKKKKIIKIESNYSTLLNKFIIKSNSNYFFQYRNLSTFNKKLPLSNLIMHVILISLYCDMLFFTGTTHDYLMVWSSFING